MVWYPTSQEGGRGCNGSSAGGERHWVDTTKSPWTQHHFLHICSAAPGSKGLRHRIVIKLPFTYPNKEKCILVSHYDFGLNFARVCAVTVCRLRP